MERYQKLAGNSVVVAYEMGRNVIRVQFTGGETCLYGYGSAGAAAVDLMKTLSAFAATSR